METKIIRERRKSVAFSFSETDELIVKAPIFLSNKKLCEIIDKNREKIDKIKLRKDSFKEKLSQYKAGELEQKARETLEKRLPYWEEKMRISPKTVKITSAKQRFGSCSSNGTVCFSKYLFMRSEKEIDYVLVHELAHLYKMDHSKGFYEIIASVMPDYKEAQKLLKNNV